MAEMLDTELSALFQVMARNFTWIDPTFVAMNQAACRYHVAKAPGEQRKYIADSNRNGWDRAWPVAQEGAKMQSMRATVFDAHLKLAARMKAAGIRFVAGTDTGIRDTYTGFSLH